MFYGFFPPWAGVLIGVGVAAFVAVVIMAFLLLMYRVTWKYFLIMILVGLVGIASITVASIQAYHSQIALFNQATTEQNLDHVDAIDGVQGTMHVYNTTGNCWVYAVYDPYQKSVILDAGRLRNGTITLNGTTVYSLTTKPLTQEGINQLCEANYGEQAFNNNDD